MGKRHLHVLIDEGVYELLVEVAVARYGRVHGSVSRIVEEALRSYLANSRGVAVKPGGAGRVHSAWMTVKDYLKRMKGYDDIKQVKLSELKQAIMGVRGADERTVRKWISRFIQQGYIKPLPEYNNTVFEVHA